MYFTWYDLPLNLLFFCIIVYTCHQLWDVATDQEALDLILPETDAKVMAEKLLQYALKKGSTDNISIMVVVL